MYQPTQSTLQHKFLNPGPCTLDPVVLNPNIIQSQHHTLTPPGHSTFGSGCDLALLQHLLAKPTHSALATFTSLIDCHKHMCTCAHSSGPTPIPETAPGLLCVHVHVTHRIPMHRTAPHCTCADTHARTHAHAIRNLLDLNAEFRPVCPARPLNPWSVGRLDIKVISTKLKTGTFSSHAVQT